MKRSLLLMIGCVVIGTLGLVGAFFVFQQETGRVGRADILAARDLGKGSIRFDEPAPSLPNIALAVELQGEPIPTNSWWQSALTGHWPEPLFTLPWSVKLSVRGLEAGIPRVTASKDSIVAPFVADLSLIVERQKLRRAEVSAHDDMSVELRSLGTTGEPALTTRLIKGLPFIYIKYGEALTLVTTGSRLPGIETRPDGRQVVTATVNGQAYRIFLSPRSQASSSGSGLTLVPGGQDDELILAAVPSDLRPDDQVAFDDAALAGGYGGSSSYRVNGGEVTTSLNWRTKAGGATAHLVLPHQRAAGAADTPALGTFLTIRGRATVVRGNRLTYHQAAFIPDLILSFPRDDAFFQKSRLEAFLVEARDTYTDPAATSYNGGKELFRLANLLMMAKQANSPTAAFFQAKLHGTLTDWMTYRPGETKRYFYYDHQVKGLVASRPEFGSEVFNDHHFHYGYFLYAAAILANYEPGFVKDYGRVVDLLAEDIASEDKTATHFTRLRVFDPYEGHSWADGMNRFADGNNQESVSEAAHAWFALAHWGRASHNQSLLERGQWLYANETLASLTYYYGDPKSNPLPAGYQHSQISLLWGGKADWTTFFSPAPEAKHVIIMLPLTAGSDYLARDGAVWRSLSALNRELGNQPVSAYGDILLMAKALADPKAAQAGFDSNIIPDSSNSMAYVYYYLGWAGQRPQVVE